MGEKNYCAAGGGGSAKRQIYETKKTIIRASLRFEKRLNFSINTRKLSIFHRYVSNRSEALPIVNGRDWSSDNA